MAGFAEILAEVEAASLGADKPAPTLPFGFDPPLAQDAAPTGTNQPPLGAIAAYRETIEKRGAIAATPISPPDAIEELAARFPRKLAAARRSPRKLASLRREIAWALHPDRIASDAENASQAMARFNAMIDAALAQCDAERF